MQALQAKTSFVERGRCTVALRAAEATPPPTSAPPVAEALPARSPSTLLLMASLAAWCSLLRSLLLLCPDVLSRVVCDAAITWFQQHCVTGPRVTALLPRLAWVRMQQCTNIVHALAGDLSCWSGKRWPPHRGGGLDWPWQATNSRWSARHRHIGCEGGGIGRGSQVFGAAHSGFVRRPPR